MKSLLKYGAILIVGLVVGWVYSNFEFDDERLRLLACLNKIDNMIETGKKAGDAQENLSDIQEKLTSALQERIKKLENQAKLREELIKQLRILKQ